jgi:pimeloyl-ACP methyl ester carboxylesterase
MRPFPVLAFGLVMLLLGAPLPVVAQPATPAASSPVAATGDFAGLVDIGGGRRLWLECRGTGSPTVVLESGYPDTADVWDTVALAPGSDQTAVLPGVASFTRVCAYDRPGTLFPPDGRSRSDPVPQPRTAADVVADLHALLHTAGVPGPYVMAGHSLGGIIIRLYAATYPDEVAGLVLVDSSHEDQNARFKAALGDENWAAFERLQEQELASLADDSTLERIDLDASFDQLRQAAAAHPLPPLPLVVLTRGVPASSQVPPEARAALPPDFPWETFDTVWQELQDELAALAPEARHVVAAESGHYIQIQQPDLVIAAIEQVVAAVRDPSTWATPAAIPVATPA